MEVNGIIINNDGIIENIAVFESEADREAAGYLPYYDGAMIGHAYDPPSLGGMQDELARFKREQEELVDALMSTVLDQAFEISMMKLGVTDNAL